MTNENQGKELNGSVDLLAKAMRQVFSETVEIRDANDAAKTTNQNMAGQFSNQQKVIADIVDKKLERTTVA